MLSRRETEVLWNRREAVLDANACLEGMNTTPTMMYLDEYGINEPKTFFEFTADLYSNVPAIASFDACLRYRKNDTCILTKFYKSSNR